MYICGLAEYLPARVVDNRYFSARTGREPEWFERRTGIRERRRAAPEENANTMAVDAVARLAETLPGGLPDVDLVIGCSYTPWDTIGTMAHVVQRRFELRTARALYISSACSSFINALELAAAFFETGRSRTALIVAVEHNSLYCSDDDDQSGHLWGDGAAAVLVSREPSGNGTIEIVDVTTAGLGHLGQGPEGVFLTPKGAGLVMPHGRDVFQHACQGMEEAARELLERHRIAASDLRLLIAHQANRRILDRVAGQLGIAPERVATTVEELGNTGCASTPITLVRHRHLLRRGDLALMVAFGGGYSSGAALMRCG